ncbi:MAG: hypothetical protein ACOCUT_04470 [bacterium]
MKLTDLERKILVESLIFTASADACLATEKFDAKLALDLAEKLNDSSLNLSCYLFKNSDGGYDEDISSEFEKRIPQIKIEKANETKL